jgi:hypothetical protein
MKRYFVFYGDTYDPNGGMIDFIGDFDSIKECKKAIREKHKNQLLENPGYDFYYNQIWDSHTRTFIENTL